MANSDFEIDRRLSFDEFLLMPSNALAHAAARSIAEGKEENSPLCLCAASGCGKTHLMNAIACRYADFHSDKTVILTSVARMIENYIAAIQDGKLAEYRKRYRSADMLLIDDLEALEGTKQFQEELLNSVDVMVAAKKLFVFASETCPMQMKISERLAEKMSGGLVVEVEKFTEGGRFEFLKYQFQKVGVEISDANVSLISDAVPGNAAGLMRAVRAVRLAAEPADGETTKACVRKALASCGIEV